MGVKINPASHYPSGLKDRIISYLNALGEITGEVSTADILEEMFSRFCVGK